MKSVLASFVIEKETKNILDYLSYVTKKSKSQLVREAILLLAQKYKEKGYNIPDKFTKRSDIVMQDIEESSDINEPENNNENVNEIEKMIIINIKEILISLLSLKSSKSFKKVDIADNRIYRMLSNLQGDESLKLAKRISDISSILNEFIKERLNISKKVKIIANLSGVFNDEQISLINFVKENKDLERLLNALNSGLDNFEKELKEIMLMYNKIKEILDI